MSAPDNDLSHEPVAVLGAGSWGTALAIQFARAGHPTRLWSRSAADVAAMRAERSNRRYLPDAPFPDAIELHDDLAAALDGAVAIIIAVPSHALRALLKQIKPLLARDARPADPRSVLRIQIFDRPRGAKSREPRVLPRHPCIGEHQRERVDAAGRRPRHAPRVAASDVDPIETAQADPRRWCARRVAGQPYIECGLGLPAFGG